MEKYNVLDKEVHQNGTQVKYEMQQQINDAKIKRPLFFQFDMSGTMEE